MKGEQYGYRFDGEDEVWYKKISQAKPRQSRQEAEDLAFQAANMIREEKGLEPKKAFAARHVKAGRRLSTFPSPKPRHP